MLDSGPAILAAVSELSVPVGVLVFAALLATAVLITFLTDRVQVPFTLVLVLVGFGAGEIAKWQGLDIELEGDTFQQVVLFGFLPVLVYASAREISARLFIRNLLPILTLAIPAYLVSAVLVAGGLHLAVGISITVALVFGVLISATDPVTVVAVFRNLGVPKRLLTLIEGESLLNDGIAIVMFQILLVAAMGGSISISAGVFDFVTVFFGGAAIGAVLAMIVVAVVPRVTPLATPALSLSLAYGSFALADEVFGFSGVMAAVTAGLIAGAFKPSVTSAEQRMMVDGLWKSIDFIANAVLFLLIGIALDAGIIASHAGPIFLAIAAVFVARFIAVVPLVSLVTRLARIPTVKWRNQFVLVWGGLRGAVALALALSLPESFAERELFIAMTGGVVLATLLLNATTIQLMVKRLELDAPSVVERFLAAIARIIGVRAARKRVAVIGMVEDQVESELGLIQKDAEREISSLDIDVEGQRNALIGQGLAVEASVYQRLHDAGTLTSTQTQALFFTVEDQIDAANMGEPIPRKSHELNALQNILSKIHADSQSGGRVRVGLQRHTYVQAQRLAANRAIREIEKLAYCPGVGNAAVDEALEPFKRWSRLATQKLDELNEQDPTLAEKARQMESAEIAVVSSIEEIEHYAVLGLLPRKSADVADEAIRKAIAGK